MNQDQPRRRGAISRLLGIPGLASRRRKPEPEVPPRPLRRLFLDDDPQRAELFLRDHPDAVWVATVPDCVAALAHPWDEIHLDHDLNGERYVDPGRDDCGMAVVRWLSLEPRPHLRRARFYVHSHNGVSATVMVIQLKSQGFQVKHRPFGIPEPPPPVPLWKTALDALRARLRRRRGEEATSDSPAGAGTDQRE